MKGAWHKQKKGLRTDHASYKSNCFDSNCQLPVKLGIVPKNSGEFLHNLLLAIPFIVVFSYSICAITNAVVEIPTYIIPSPVCSYTLPGLYSRERIIQPY